MSKKIVFIRARISSDGGFRPKDIWAPLEIEYPCALLESQGYKTYLLDCDAFQIRDETILKRIILINPDLVVLSFHSHRLDWVLSLCNIIKKKMRNIIICTMGPHITFDSESVIFRGSPVDYCLLGEVEYSILNLLNSFKDGNQRNLSSSCYKKKGDAEVGVVKDLDSLPFPRHRLFLNNNYSNIFPLKVRQKVRWGFILSSRGCPNRCGFCAPNQRVSFGHKLRTRSTKKVVDEIEIILKEGGNVITFLDDNISASHTHLNSLCEEIITRGVSVKWVAHARPDELSYMLLKKMKRAGCCLLKLGVESGSEKILKGIRKTKDPSNWRKKVLKSFRWCNLLGIDTTALMIIGSPKENEKDIRETKSLIAEMEPSFIRLSYFTPYPGVDLFKGRFGLNRKCRLHHQTYMPGMGSYLGCELNERELKNMISKMYFEFYLNPKFIINFVNKYLPFYLLNMRVLFKSLVWFLPFFRT